MRRTANSAGGDPDAAPGRPLTWGTRRTDWGWISVGLNAAGVARVCLPEAEQPGPPPAEARGEASARVEAALDQLEQYLAGSGREFNLPLELSGLTDFALRVLEACRGIPYGETRTYAELAAAAGSPRAARAVGQVMARNPLPLVIPCHRVVATGGGWGGYGGGLAMKRRLLALERESLLTGTLPSED